MTLTVKHASLTGAPANPSVLVDGPKWDADHSLTGAASATQGGFGSDISGQSGVPLFASGAPSFISTTGSGAFVQATSPTLVNPILGTPTSGTLTNCTGLPVSTGLSGLGTGVAAFLATPSSANLRAAITDETGSGAAVFANSPALAGTPTAPTQSSGDNSTNIATTAFVKTAVMGGNTFQQADRLSDSFLTLTSGVVTDIISFSLPAGNWLVWGNVVFAAQGTTAYSETHVSISTTSGTLDGSPGSANAEHVTYITGQSAIKPTAPKHLVLGGTTTVYLTATHTLTGGSAMLAYGSIFALPVGA